MKRSALALAVIIWGAGWVAADESSSADKIAAGKIAFEAYCARCHGVEGKGNGPDAKRLYITPRDFTSGRFKFKSTVSGTPPSDDDLIKGILGHGIAGSGMPSFGTLEPDVKSSIVQYVKTFSPIFKTAPKPIDLPANFEGKVDLKAGQEKFSTLQCALCHGASGRANGTSAFTLKDATGNPIFPTDLTQGWTYGGGHQPIDVYNRVLAGIEGAPMPSYEGAATHEEIWNLANYVASLQIQPNFSLEIIPAKAKGALPTKVDDAAWDQATRTDVNVDDFVYANDRRQLLSINTVSVQAVKNEDTIAFRLRWDDPSESRQASPDGVLVGIKPADYAGSDPRGNLHSLYAPDAPPLDVTVWESAHPDAAQRAKTTLASLSHGVPGGAALPASAVYEDGRWTVVWSRPVASFANPEELESGKPILIGFGAWDGGNGETAVKRAVSQWVRLLLADQIAAHH